MDDSWFIFLSKWLSASIKFHPFVIKCSSICSVISTYYQRMKILDIIENLFKRTLVNHCKEKQLHKMNARRKEEGIAQIFISNWDSCLWEKIEGSVWLMGYASMGGQG